MIDIKYISIRFALGLCIQLHPKEYDPQKGVALSFLAQELEFTPEEVAEKAEQEGLQIVETIGKDKHKRVKFPEE